MMYMGNRWIVGGVYLATSPSVSYLPYYIYIFTSNSEW